MTDSRSSSKYIKALEEVRKLDKEPVGFSDFTTSIPSNNIPNVYFIDYVNYIDNSSRPAEDRVSSIIQTPTDCYSAFRSAAFVLT